MFGPDHGLAKPRSRDGQHLCLVVAALPVTSAGALRVGGPSGGRGRARVLGRNRTPRVRLNLSLRRGQLQPPRCERHSQARGRRARRRPRGSTARGHIVRRPRRSAAYWRPCPARCRRLHVQVLRAQAGSSARSSASAAHPARLEPPCTGLRSPELHECVHLSRTSTSWSSAAAQIATALVHRCARRSHRGSRAPRRG